MICIYIHILTISHDSSSKSDQETPAWLTYSINSKLGENSVLSKPGTPSGPGHCHHLENWDKINCRWGAGFFFVFSFFLHSLAVVFTKHTLFCTCTNKIDSLNDFTHRFMIPGILYVWKEVSFCQAISGCPPVMSVCVCARTYKQVVKTLTHTRSCSSCLSTLAASFYWQLLADADMLCARIPISRMCSLAALMLALKHTEAVPVAFSIYRGHLCFPPSMWIITSKSDASTRWGIEMPEPLMREAALAVTGTCFWVEEMQN